MRRLFFAVMAVAATVLASTSCTKEESGAEQEATGTIKISVINPGGTGVTSLATKGTGLAHNNQSDDNTIQTLEIFVFNKGGVNAGELDAYRRFETPASLTDLEIRTTVGLKEIFVVANSHKSNWNGVLKIEQFKQQIAELKSDNLKSFVMTGYAQQSVESTSTVTITVQRMAAKVVLESLKTDFANTPYQGMKLSNVKVYLTNAHSQKYFWNGEEASAGKILNSKMLVPADTASCVMRGMIADKISAEIGDSGDITPHYFYAFENLLDAETSSARFTRLVIQADLNGKTYYYPVNVNQPYFGHVDTNGHKGLKRNTEYRISVTIKRPGAINPDETILFGTLTTNLTILNWVTTAVANPEF